MASNSLLECLVFGQAAANQTRMLSSSASTAHTEPKCSTIGYLHRLMKCGKLRTSGYKAITKNDPMTHWEACPWLCSVSDCSQGKILLLNCLLDGEASVSCLRTQSCKVCGTHPILGAMDSMVAHKDGYSPRCSNTMRTARSRTSGENLVDFFMTPFSQMLEPPPNRGRFTAPNAIS